MYLGFWEKLQKPIYCLAPMADVTDAAFRRLIAQKSKTDSKGHTTGATYVSWTEFVSADGLALAPEEGRQKLLKALLYSEIERPVVAQFFGSQPEHMEAAARLALELGFDGVDINMGCPDRSIERQGAGAAMIKTPEVAREIIRAVMRGARLPSPAASVNGGQAHHGDKQIPVSVKTRLGYNTDELDTWLPVLLEEEPAVVTIHARTRKEMSKVPAHWERIKNAVKIRDDMGSKTLIIGNGDLGTLREGDQKIAETGADGVMFGRGDFGNPWFFNKDLVSDDAVALPVRGEIEGDRVKYSNTKISKADKVQALLEHAELFNTYLGDTKSFAVMKKHVKAYISGFEDAKEIRDELMQAKNIEEFRTILRTY